MILSFTAAPGTLVRSYAIQVQERSTREIAYRSGSQLVSPSTGERRELHSFPLRVALRMERAGTYLIHVRASDGDLSDDPRVERRGELFYATLHTTSGTSEIVAPLLPVPPAFDADGDRFPDALRWPAALPEAEALYRNRKDVLDCVDQDPMPGAPALPARLRAADIHPLAKERCGLFLDVTCSGAARACVDADGDGDPRESDCDDEDPRRFHGNPRPRNCCRCTDRQSCAVDHEKIAALATCTPPRCDDDYDFDCTGLVVDCFTDEDCDGYSPHDPVESQRDCDDLDARVHPGAEKRCSDPSKDWACDGNPQGGCVECDLDGDGFQRRDEPGTKGAHCPDEGDRHPGQVDCDDDDRGVFPGSTSYAGPTLILRSQNGQEGGSVAGALRGLCRNLTPSGAPQDADCDGFARAGCPPIECDADGDGFPSGKAGCNPRLLPEDCDDADPHTFPGAPDFCKDAKAQNCSTPLPCGIDRDGDGYNVEVDCDDTPGVGASVHPFADEVCNGRDDDCDGLIDELNPGPDGQRLIESHIVGGEVVTSTTSCNDSSVGECGQRDPVRGGFTGRCVCTGVEPNTRPNETDRVACPGTKPGGAIAPKCFGAYQPRPQTCDADRLRDDDCDGRDDAPDGKNLLEYGEICGVDTGECKAGKVVGCDKGKLNPFSKEAGRQVVPEFPSRKRFLVCDGQTVAPRDELCNGKDDDCDGPDAALTEGEADLDMDGYLACSGCAGEMLAEGVLGCDDCRDMDDKVHPGAKELCDGKNNACAEMSVDGADECKDAPKDRCCAGTPMCVDVLTDFAHCGKCGAACTLRTANKCVAGKCMCGANPACADLLPICKDGMICVECLMDADCPDMKKCMNNACV